MNAARPVTPRRRHSAVWWVLLPAVALAAMTCTVLISPVTPLPGDAAFAELALHHRSWAVTTALTAITTAGTWIAPYLVALVAGLTLARDPVVTSGPRPGARRLAVVTACLVWLALGQAIRFGLMTVVARPRPPAEHRLTHASRFAFPSGHATTSAMAAELLVVALSCIRPPHRRWLITLATGWAATVGISRVWLGVHWASDVAAGRLLAVLRPAIGSLLLTRLLPRSRPVARWCQASSGRQPTIWLVRASPRERDLRGAPGGSARPRCRSGHRRSDRTPP
ncbi:phosphatase PAP2 family protein [Streptomyces sp. NPDC006553]|uniref:phosphatase PAP2 family protein n=1 Tax=Streptomyces sp. NPDC006553 TaxID=3157180 RepID=UPI0033BF25FB